MSPADDGEYVVHTYDESGQIVALPKEAAAVVAAHVPPPAPVAPDYGDEAPTDFERQAAAVVASLREYLALSSPTGAQTVAALKVLIRVVLALLRRTL